jgi:HD-like signal output (HDOD) protein
MGHDIERSQPFVDPPDDNGYRNTQEGGPLIEDIAQLKTACSLPGTLLRVLEVIADEGSTKQTLARVIEGDPDLCERVLHIANSPLYLTYNDRIDDSAPAVTNLPTAVLKLGFAGVRNVAFTQGLCEMARGGHELGVGIAAHLLVVAELGRGLGFRHSRTLGEDTYFCGLMHDFGKLALLRTLPLEYLRIAAHCQTRRIPAVQAEDALLSPAQPLIKNHLVAGAELLRAHGLPEETASAIERHHDDPAIHVCDEATWEVPCLVIVANQLAYALGYPDGLNDENPAYLPIQELAKLLGMNQEVMDEILREGVTRATDAIAASRLPVKPALLSRIHEIEQRLSLSAATALQEPRPADQPYATIMTLIDLTRSRARIGFYDFKARTGLRTGELRGYLDQLVACGYLRTIQDDEARLSYEATQRMHDERPHDILRTIVMDGRPGEPDVA